jgi:hypothetical protein
MTTILRGDDDFDTASPSGAGNFTAKAWVNWKNSGGNALIASGNVSSVTDNNTGVYTVSFSTSFSAATYVPAGQSNTNGVSTVPAIGFNTNNGGATYTTAACGHASEDVDAGFTDYINNCIMYLH